LEFNVDKQIKDYWNKFIVFNDANNEEWQYEECPDGVLDVYHMRNCNEGINSYLKDHLEVETHVNGKGLKQSQWHDCRKE